MRQPGEPSIDEILESIKQVISREDRSTTLSAIRSESPIGTGESAGAADPLALSYADIVPARASSPSPPLMADTGAKAARGSLEALAGAIATGAAQNPPVTTGSAAEALLRELLRPALADWLDRNLPAIVEKMVAAEIARITGRG